MKQPHVFDAIELQVVLKGLSSSTPWLERDHAALCAYNPACHQRVNPDGCPAVNEDASRWQQAIEQCQLRLVVLAECVEELGYASPLRRELQVDLP
jgi:hypothetical protein